jgi:hypothetical protein
MHTGLLFFFTCMKKDALALAQKHKRACLDWTCRQVNLPDVRPFVPRSKYSGALRI